MADDLTRQHGLQEVIESDRDKLNDMLIEILPAVASRRVSFDNDEDCIQIVSLCLVGAASVDDHDLAA